MTIRDALSKGKAQQKALPNPLRPSIRPSIYFLSVNEIENNETKQIEIIHYNRTDQPF